MSVGSPFSHSLGELITERRKYMVAFCKLDVDHLYNYFFATIFRDYVMATNRRINKKQKG